MRAGVVCRSGDAAVEGWWKEDGGDTAGRALRGRRSSFCHTLRHCRMAKKVLLGGAVERSFQATARMRRAAAVRCDLHVKPCVWGFRRVVCCRRVVWAAQRGGSRLHMRSVDQGRFRTLQWGAQACHGTCGPKQRFGLHRLKNQRCVWGGPVSLVFRRHELFKMRAHADK